MRFEQRGYVGRHHRHRVAAAHAALRQRRREPPAARRELAYVYARRPWRTAIRCGQSARSARESPTGVSGTWFAGRRGRSSLIDSYLRVGAGFRPIAERALHQHGVEPAVVLAADVREPPDFGETVRAVQRDRSGIVRARR
jgi:hypothetical protein